MPRTGELLTKFKAFRATRAEELEATVGTMGGRLLAARSTRDLGALGNRVVLPSGELWFCSYKAPVHIAFGESDYHRLQLPLNGVATTRFSGRTFAVSPSLACLSSAAASIDFGANLRQIAWRVQRGALVRKLHARIEQPVTGSLDFDPVIRLDTASAQALLQTVRCMIEVLAAGNEPQGIVVAELEHAMIASLLWATGHRFRSALEKQPAAATPAHLRRAEEFIEANCHRALSIDEIANAASTSVRSLYRSFRSHRGQSPREFMKRRRLASARRLLQQGSSSVTHVAVACGFGDLSHFSKEFFKAFGELPSDVARRAR